MCVCIYIYIYIYITVLSEGMHDMFLKEKNVE